MIPDIVPVNTWQGNNSNIYFEFDFLINAEDELKVLLTDEHSRQIELKLNIDYSINQVGNANGSYITFPLNGSSYGKLKSTQTLSLLLNIPIAQTNPFGTSAKLNLESIEYALDYVTRLIQILSRRVDRSIKVQEGVTSDIDLNTENVYKNIQMIEDSARQYSMLSEAEAEKSLEYAILSKKYANEAMYGMRWQSFTANNWQATSDKYEMFFPDLSIINFVYKGNLLNRELVINIDIQILETGVKIISLEAFDGFIIHADSILGSYQHEQTLEADEWVINHNLGKYPVVTIVDSDNVVMLGTVQYTTLNQIKITFTNAVKGKVFLS